MKYISKDGSVPTPSSHSGFWFKPPDQVFDVTESSHVMFMVEHPDLFGLTLDEIKAVYAAFGETLGTDGGQARERLVRMAVRSGFVRIRKYQRPMYFSIQCYSTVNQREEIVLFIRWAIESAGVMKTDDAAVILGFENEKDRHSYTWEDGGIATYMGRQKENP
jgi:hypothetical protein